MVAAAFPVFQIYTVSILFYLPLFQLSENLLSLAIVVMSFYSWSQSLTAQTKLSEKKRKATFRRKLIRSNVRNTNPKVSTWLVCHWLWKYCPMVPLGKKWVTFEWTYLGIRWRLFFRDFVQVRCVKPRSILMFFAPWNLLREILFSMMDIVRPAGSNRTAPRWLHGKIDRP